MRTFLSSGQFYHVWFTSAGYGKLLRDVIAKREDYLETDHRGPFWFVRHYWFYLFITAQSVRVWISYLANTRHYADYLSYDLIALAVERSNLNHIDVVAALFQILFFFAVYFVVNHHSDIAVWRMVAVLLTENHREFVHCNGRYCTTTGKDFTTWYRTPVIFLWTGYDLNTGYRVRFHGRSISGFGQVPTQVRSQLVLLNRVFNILFILAMRLTCKFYLPSSLAQIHLLNRCCLHAGGNLHGVSDGPIAATLADYRSCDR